MAAAPTEFVGTLDTFTESGKYADLLRKYGLDAAGIRVETDLRNEKIGKKIAEGRVQKIPYLLVIGDKEAESGSVAVRSRAGDEGAVPLADFIARVRAEIDSKKM